ncbi:fasciclin domain-containing protein [Tabrizicola sp. J26]|uniref:fasciclin domain-containing protein n=1 Tax=Alitabrizicola rongguiensis TaxID=2909234 RepID=UPI001F3C927A|nr:fasciclin domain-containing protein [Tabrizicola rongguiensis]MCF1708351.1 fasciclin domain-containing protein [Tabrizicola rongguiensis]
MINKRRFFGLAGALAVSAVVAACTPVSTRPDIVGVAASNNQFSTLVAAVQAAGLADTLKGDGPFTLFAPTDAAFAALPAGTVENLLKPENKDQLVKILTYHVVPGAVTSDQLAGKRMNVATVEGSDVHINATGSSVRVNNATVTQADIIASNGVIHRIDRVLLPN